MQFIRNIDHPVCVNVMMIMANRSGDKQICKNDYYLTIVQGRSVGASTYIYFINAFDYRI